MDRKKLQKLSELSSVILNSKNIKDISKIAKNVIAIDNNSEHVKLTSDNLLKVGLGSNVDVIYSKDLSGFAEKSFFDCWTLCNWEWKYGYGNCRWGKKNQWQIQFYPYF